MVDYVDQKGKLHLKTFTRKKDADAHEATVTVEVRQGHSHRGQPKRDGGPGRGEMARHGR